MNNTEILEEARAVGLSLQSVERFQNAVQAEIDSMGSFEFTLLLIKKFCVDKRDAILKHVTDSGLRIVAMEKVTFARMDAVRFAIIRAQGKDLPLDLREHSATLESLVEGPAEAVIVAGIEAVNKMIALAGPDDPIEARESNPDSLRSLFGGDGLVENGLHCSVNQKEAHAELSLIFPNYIDLIKSRGLTSQVDQWLWSLWRSEPEGNQFSSRLFDITFINLGPNDRRTNIRELFRFVRDKISGLVTSFTSKLPAASKSISVEPDDSSEIPPLVIPEIESEISMTKLKELSAHDSSREFEVEHSIRQRSSFAERTGTGNEPSFADSIRQRPAFTEPTGTGSETAHQTLSHFQSQYVRRRTPDLRRRTHPPRKTFRSSHYDVPQTPSIPANFEAASAVDMYQGKLTDESGSRPNDASTSGCDQRLKSDSETIFEDVDKAKEPDCLQSLSEKAH